jgi:hypothetical protein
VLKYKKRQKKSDLHGERVHVRPERDEGRTTRADGGDDAGDGEGVPVGDPHGVELPTHELAGFELLVPELRVLVDPPPHPDHPVHESRVLDPAEEPRGVLQDSPRRRQGNGGEHGEGDQERRRRGGHVVLVLGTRGYEGERPFLTRREAAAALVFLFSTFLF